jgi:DNA-binding HxlR family transcriptional regulator
MKNISALAKEDLAEDHTRCPLRDLLSRLGDKWSLLVIMALAKADGNRSRFSILMRSVNGISQRMLTTTLRYLERDGIVSRHIYPEVPPRVEYALTKRGLSLLEPVSALVTWVEAHWPEIEKSRSSFDDNVGQTGTFS